MTPRSLPVGELPIGASFNFTDPAMRQVYGRCTVVAHGPLFDLAEFFTRVDAPDSQSLKQLAVYKWRKAVVAP